VHSCKAVEDEALPMEHVPAMNASALSDSTNQYQSRQESSSPIDVGKIYGAAEGLSYELTKKLFFKSIT
jgi:hypothetical protein